jgi:acyl-CoA synthetase (AMP-forming)/AMP-acid ligase II
MDLLDRDREYRGLASRRVRGGCHRHPASEWQERPLLLVHPKPGANPTKESILEFLSTRIAKWWMPDDAVFVESLPHTATGKLLKTELRAKYGGQFAVAG